MILIIILLKSEFIFPGIQVTEGILLGAIGAHPEGEPHQGISALCLFKHPVRCLYLEIEKNHWCV